MDIFFQDPNDVPVPPEEVRIRAFTVEPWPDGRRVRVNVELTPFQKRPNGEINIKNGDEQEVSSVSFIETIDPKMQFTMHLRTKETVGEYTATATVFYPILEEAQDVEEHQNQDSILLPKETMVVDQASLKFSISSDTESPTS